MNNKYSVKVFHPEGHYRNSSGFSRRLTSDYDIDTGYDSFEAKLNPVCEVVYWNRIYKNA